MADTTPTNPPTPPSSTPPTPAPSHNAQHERRWSFSLWRLFVGLLIILFGLQLLANNYGWDWSINLDIARLWPVILIVIGISMMTKGRFISAAVGTILALSVISVAAVVIITQPAAVSRTTVERPINVAAETAATAGIVRVDLGAADISITGGGTGLVTGSFVSNIGDLDLDSRLSGTDQTVTIDTKNETRQWLWFGSTVKNDLDLQLGESLPLDLDINTGAADLDLDLRTVMARRVTIDAGASSTTLKLGALINESTVRISSGASSINVSVPQTVGVRLDLDAGLSGKTLPSELKKINDGLYETDGYATAEKKINLSIDAGASSITINLE